MPAANHELVGRQPEDLTVSSGELATTRVPTVEVMVHGDLDATSVPRISELLHEATQLHPKLLIIDLAECPSIDATGIILLLDTHRRVIHDGGVVALRSPSPRLRRKLRLARVDRVLQTIADSPDIALTDHGPTAAPAAPQMDETCAPAESLPDPIGPSPQELAEHRCGLYANGPASTDTDLRSPQPIS